MDTRDIYKLVREFEEEKDDVINLYDSLDIELSEDFVIETGIVGFTEDGVIVHLDEDAMEFLDFNGVLLESEDINEDSDSIDAVYNAVLNRIARQHTDVLAKYGPEAVMKAVEDIAHSAGSDGLEEIGSSDVSIWTKQAIEDLENGAYKYLDEGVGTEQLFKVIANHPEPHDLVYNAISGDYGEDVRKAMQEIYDDVVIDSEYGLHPDDDFEKIIDRIVQMAEKNTPARIDVVENDEISRIKKLALGESAEELDLDESAKDVLGPLAGLLLISTPAIATIAAWYGLEKREAAQLVKTEPQLITLTQMHQEAVKQGDEEKADSIERRIEATIRHIYKTGRPVMGPDGKPIDPRTNPEYKGVKELGAGAINIAKWTGIDKMEASHLLKTQPQLITLMQMYQEAVKQGDEEKADSIERRIYDTAWTIKKTGRPVLGPDFKPIDPRTNPDYQNVYEAEELDEGLGKALLGGAALIAAITGINKMEANHLMKTEPQLITLSQMHQEAVKQGDEYRAKEIEDRIEKTLDFIRVKGRPVMGVDGKPVDPREPVGEAEYQGRKVPLGKPMQGDVKKSKVYVKKPNGKVVKVNFGDKNMRIKKSNPNRRKSFRARHNCDNPGPRWKARYWSCRAW